MSKPNEKVTGTAPKTEPPPGKNTSGLVVTLFFFLGVVVSLLVGWDIIPIYSKVMYTRTEQPFQFSHVVHGEAVEEGCESCHLFREDGTYAGTPTLAQCVDCHEEMQGDTEEEKIFVDEYVSKGKEVPWLIYSRQPDCVFFSHAAHVKKAEMECRECHGDIGQSETLKPYEENWLTGYSRDIWGKNIAGFSKNPWDRMKMDDCGRCHEEKMGHKGHCFQCHK